MFEYLELFVRQAGATAIWATFATGFTIILAASAFAVLLIRPARRLILPPPIENRFADYLPFSHIERDGITISTKRRIIARVWRLEGLEHRAMSHNARRALHAARRTALDQINPTGVNVRVFSFREEVRTPGRATRTDPNQPLAVREIDARWHRGFERNVYRNRHYLACYATASTAGRRQLDDAGSAIAITLGQYRPKLLDANTAARAAANGQNTGEIDGPLTPFAAYLSPASKPNPVLAPESDIADLLTADEVAFERAGRVTFAGNDGVRHMGIVSVRSVPEAFQEQTMLELLRINAEITVVHAIEPISRAKAIVTLGQESKTQRLASFGHGGGGAATFEEVLAILQGTHPERETANLFLYTLTVFAYGRTEEERDEAILAVERALATAGITTVSRGFAAESAWWLTLPGWNVSPHPWRILTDPIASMFLPQTAPRGLQQSDWANRAITSFRSAEGAQYGFTFHAAPDQEAPGHIVVIGPTGGGKTTLLSHLACQTLTLPDTQVWLFDRNNGAEVFTHACDGTYVHFESGHDTGTSLNPFHLDDAPQHRQFLREWVEALVGSCAAEDRDAIARAVDIAFDYLTPDMRSLAHIHSAAFTISSRPRQQLAKWTSKDQMGAIFNGAADSFAGLQSRLVGFDCTRAFNDPELAGPLIMYLLHRIRTASAAHGRPTLIYMDETAPMLQNEQFRTFFEQVMQEGRKLRQVLVCCFQRPGAIESSGVSEIIRLQCPTGIFLRNPQAQASDYAQFTLTHGELDFILGRTHRDLPHAALVKRWEGEHTAILNTSLTPLGQWIRIYASGTQAVLRLRTLIRQHGRERGIREYVEAA